MKTMDGVEIQVGLNYCYLTPIGKRYWHLPSSVTAEVRAITKKRVMIRYRVDGKVYTRHVSPEQLIDISDEDIVSSNILRG